MKDIFDQIKALLKKTPQVYLVVPKEFIRIQQLQEVIEEHRKLLNFKILTLPRQKVSVDKQIFNDKYEIEKQKLLKFLATLNKDALVIIPTHSLSKPMQFDPSAFMPGNADDPWLEKDSASRNPFDAKVRLQSK